MIVQNFKIIGDSKVKPPYLSKLNIVENLQVYESSFNNRLYVIYEEELDNFHQIEYFGSNFDKDIVAYVTYRIKTQQHSKLKKEEKKDEK